uniref:low-density lipoprotein receptor-related protein 6-like isoform X2 n=1 Tax=Ciona intestinalis TaxID=7719 RepID=UPI00089DCFC9|nr:low-density lipoprotein receptor-related protein 6-like isoform X2 [Ciona intestinalis]|eukprot:XP_018667559.1 low-density lipoprotein receptor-related protein 6-like isoform X2 [Ciona intestinalis]
MFANSKMRKHLSLSLPRFVFLCVVCLAVTLLGTEAERRQDCVDGPSTWYRGTHNTTVTGTACQRWTATVPHRPKYIPQDGGEHNYCRNPDGDLKGTWCYTMNVSSRWEYCNIPKCFDDSLVIWTNYDAQSQSTHLLSVMADPEVVKNKTDTSGVFNVSVMVGSNKTHTEFWALAGHYAEKKLFFTDYRSEYVGVRYIRRNITARYYKGMAHGIESMAYDWKANNLYWTDSEFKWIMASDRTFRYYSPVFRTGHREPPYGLAIHSKLRKLYFSTYKAFGSKIMVTDLAGKNPQTLFQFPDVFDVTGLTVDYTDERLYWTDFTGYGAMVMSSRMDGTNKTQIYYRQGSIFWGVAAYMDYLYVTDVHARYTNTANKYYSVWVVIKQSKQVFRYTLHGKPRGIAVLSHNEERSMDEVSTNGECDDQPTCDHICLPRINATRECVCSLGYHKRGDTSCITDVQSDESMFFVDSGQGKIFQIPFNAMTSTHPNNYTIVPTGTRTNTETVAVDIKTRQLLWSDKRRKQILRGSFDGARGVTLVQSIHASSMTVDPQTGNIFFVDDEFNSIYVVDHSGNKMTELMRSNSNETDIKMIAQDVKSRYLYWTDTRSDEGAGQVWRIRLDGSEKELVLDNLDWPHAITVDHIRGSLFVSEAKTAMIFEIPLSTLVGTINSTSIQNIPLQHDLAGQLPRLRFYILDIKVYNNYVYFVDGKSNRMERFNLTRGVASITQFGPSEFFRITNLAVYSSTYQKQFFNSLPSPCTGRQSRCRHICVAKSDFESVCLCPEGSAHVTETLCSATTSTNRPPRLISCQEHSIIWLPSCASTAMFSWTAPVWTDEEPTSNLTVVGPTRTSDNLGPGNHVFTYRATDSGGLSSTCRITVDVRNRSCVAPPPLPPQLSSTTPTCGNRYGSTFVISCVDRTKSIRQGGASGELLGFTVTNLCLPEGSWDLGDMNQLTCVPTPGQPTTTTTTSTTTTRATINTNTPPQTRTTTTTRATINTNTPPQTRTTTTTRATINTNTLPQTRTTTTTRATINTNTLPPTTTTTTTSRNIGPARRPTITTIPIRLITTTSTTAGTPAKSSTTSPNNGTRLLAGPRSAKKGGLKSGPLAAIIVLVVLLVIVIAVVVFVTIRRRGSPWLTKINFPLFWKRQEDTVDLQSRDCNNHYQVM